MNATVSVDTIYDLRLAQPTKKREKIRHDVCRRLKIFAAYALTPATHEGAIVLYVQREI